MSNFDQMPRASNDSLLRYPERDTLGVPPPREPSPRMASPRPMGLRSGRLNPRRLAAARIALAWGDCDDRKAGRQWRASGWELVSTTTQSDDDGGRKLSLKEIGVLRVAERDI